MWSIFPKTNIKASRSSGRGLGLPIIPVEEMWTLSVATTTMKELFDGRIVVFAVSSWLIALPMQYHAIDALTAVRPLCSVYRFHRAHEFV